MRWLVCLVVVGGCAAAVAIDDPEYGAQSIPIPVLYGSFGDPLRFGCVNGKLIISSGNRPWWFVEINPHLDGYMQVPCTVNPKEILP